jgi:hypothetical protein
MHLYCMTWCQVTFERGIEQPVNKITTWTKGRVVSAINRRTNFRELHNKRSPTPSLNAPTSHGPDVMLLQQLRCDEQAEVLYSFNS